MVERSLSVRIPGKGLVLTKKVGERQSDLSVARDEPTIEAREAKKRAKLGDVLGRVPVLEGGDLLRIDVDPAT